MDAAQESNSFFIIVHPNGDRSKLTVVEIVRALDYEKNDYMVASDLEFETAELASAYARPLAARWRKEYEPYDGEPLPALTSSDDALAVLRTALETTLRGSQSNPRRGEFADGFEAGIKVALSELERVA